MYSSSSAKEDWVMLQISFNLRGEIRDWLIETVVAYYANLHYGQCWELSPQNSTLKFSPSAAGRTGLEYWLKIRWQRAKGSDAWEKKSLCHCLYQKVGNNLPVIKNQKW